MIAGFVGILRISNSIQPKKVWLKGGINLSIYPSHVIEILELLFISKGFNWRHYSMWPFIWGRGGLP